MAKAIVIEADGTMAVTTVNDLADLQQAVGGYIEGIYLGDTGQFAYVNEDGIALDLPRNSVATDLCYAHRVGLLPGDYIKGTMVIVGPADADGNDTDVSDDLIAELQRRVTA